MIMKNIELLFSCCGCFLFLIFNLTDENSKREIFGVIPWRKKKLSINWKGMGDGMFIIIIMNNSKNDILEKVLAKMAYDDENRMQTL